MRVCALVVATLPCHRREHDPELDGAARQSRYALGVCADEAVQTATCLLARRYHAAGRSAAAQQDRGTVNKTPR